MPKEVVYSSELPWGPDDLGVAITEVRWSREGSDVQVVTKAVRRTDHARLRAENEPLDYTDGFYVNLDRRGINDLIRHLRRARDQAFGRDE